MYLDQATFTTIIESTPLISIDLVVENAAGEVLLGLRNNKPAQGFWFVPGGRVLKNETLDCAFHRLCQEELGIELARQQADFLGPFEHFYDDCVFDDAISTHYVVLGYRLHLDLVIDFLPQQQHNQYAWFAQDEMLQSDKVHVHSKWYLDK
ncbi:GDP-mannose mannosyl hydrolase [Amphritea sp.]|uniref:GDP-mannose mannosyl hydrolase n=1 Tax=Amphritea sp. TaxID=1872502 RepID=UPI003A930B32